MHLWELQAVLGLGGPCQSSSQGRRADRADGVVHLHSDSDLVSPDGSSIATFSVPALVHQEGRTIVRRYVDDPEAGQLPGKNPTTASRTVWPENLDRPGHRASQPNRVSDTSTEDPASSTSSRSIRRGEFHPPGRSRTPSKSTKRELRACGGCALSGAGSSRLMNWSRESRQNWSRASSSPMRNGCQDEDSCVTGRSGSLGSFDSSSPFSPSPVPACSDRLCPTVTVLTGRNETAAAASPSNAPGLSSAVEVSIVRVSRVAIRGSAASRRGCNPGTVGMPPDSPPSWNVRSVAASLPSVAA